MTHSEIILLAEKWLKGRARCGVVLSEPAGALKEIPDVVGWKKKGKDSILIECKSSRSDFLADRKKRFRQSEELGVGKFRYFMAPKGLIAPKELPKGWGLLEIDKNMVRVSVRPQRKNFSKGSRIHYQELAIMYSELRKIQILQAGGTLSPSKSALAYEKLFQCGREQNKET